jgi:hypothetical protein
VSRTTVAGAKAEVVSQLTAAQATFGSADVFAYQCDVRELDNGRGVCVFTAGITPDFWQIGVRIIVTATVSPKDAQDLLDTYTLAVDAALNAHYGPSNWTFAFPTDDAPWSEATNVLQVGREDY